MRSLLLLFTGLHASENARHILLQARYCFSGPRLLGHEGLDAVVFRRLQRSQQSTEKVQRKHHGIPTGIFSNASTFSVTRARSLRSSLCVCSNPVCTALTPLTSFVSWSTLWTQAC